MERTGNIEEAARLHYTWCPGCGEYKSHSITSTRCRGFCTLPAHDDPKCPLVGKITVDKTHEHSVGCYDC